VAGEWSTREPLPGEAELSHEFGVSVGTVRKAMDKLMRDNIVIRERGRGTFVRNGTEWRSTSVFRLRSNGSDQAKTEISIIDSRVELAEVAAMQLLKPRGPPWSMMRLLKIYREWRISGSLVCHEKIILDESRFPGLLDSQGLEAETLFELYTEKYREKIESIRWRIGGDSPTLSSMNGRWTAEVAGPTLPVTRVALDDRGDPIEISSQIVSLPHCIVDIVR